MKRMNQNPKLEKDYEGIEEVIVGIGILLLIPAIIMLVAIMMMVIFS